MQVAFSCLTLVMWPELVKALNLWIRLDFDYEGVLLCKISLCMEEGNSSFVPKMAMKRKLKFPSWTRTQPVFKVGNETKAPIFWDGYLYVQMLSTGTLYKDLVLNPLSFHILPSAISQNSFIICPNTVKTYRSMYVIKWQLKRSRIIWCRPLHIVHNFIHLSGTLAIFLAHCDRHSQKLSCACEDFYSTRKKITRKYFCHHCCVNSWTLRYICIHWKHQSSITAQFMDIVASCPETGCFQELVRARA